MPALIVPDKIYYIASAIITLIVLLGIYLMSKVEKAYGGNALSAVAMALAIGLTLIKYDVFGSDVRTALIVIIAGMLVGSALGIWITYAVKMIQMPQTVALLNGFGGGASALVASLTLITVEDASTFSLVTGVLALVVGLVTLFGSLVAAAKLQGIMGSKPVILQGHSAFTIISLVASFVLCGVILFVKPIPVIIAASITSIAFGILFSIRVGGADMPITISLLNSFSGVAGSIAGLAIGDVLLVAIGGIVGASGLILTQIMCRAMNRHLFDILLGKTSTPAKKSSKKSVTSDIKTDDSTGDVEDTVKEVIEEVAKEVIDEMKGATKTESGISALLKNAKDVIFVPGYGMALAQAQSLVKQLADGLEANGVTTRYAIHPVAG
ncbi:MAG: NAD(P)(+) transhydrogenase (Re/Si-specific) subunit beta, partial [Ruminococcaceae bacterium]|nr:NAD(P)(+) transhydrogenase (Re/Si-specific) subunit beta [Oscillospiraceae bacterium]